MFNANDPVTGSNPNSLKNILLRIVVSVVAMLLLYAGYDFISDYTNCSGPRAQAWIEASMGRIEEANGNWETFQATTNRDDYSSLADQAKARLDAQQAETTPKCLAFAQESTIELFLQDWNALRSFAMGETDLGNNYAAKAQTAFEELSVEINYLSGRYGWEDN